MTDDEVTKIFLLDSRIEYVKEYCGGWVPNAYKWPCERAGIIHYRNGEENVFYYDAKRSYGRGPRWAAFSARGGRLASSRTHSI